MIISYITPLPTDNLHADAVVIGITIKTFPVRDKSNRTRCCGNNNKGIV